MTAAKATTATSAAMARAVLRTRVRAGSTQRGRRVHHRAMPAEPRPARCRWPKTMSAVSAPSPSTAVHMREPAGPEAAAMRAAPAIAVRTAHSPDIRRTSRERRTDHRVMSAWRTVRPSSGRPTAPSGLAALPHAPPRPRPHSPVAVRRAVPTDSAAAASMEDVAAKTASVGTTTSSQPARTDSTPVRTAKGQSAGTTRRSPPARAVPAASETTRSRRAWVSPALTSAPPRRRPSGTARGRGPRSRWACAPRARPRPPEPPSWPGRCRPSRRRWRRRAPWSCPPGR